MSEKTCFVIMGFGEKTDLATKQKFNLDKTYKNIIKPVFKKMGFYCFRADDIVHSGNIDVVMYENILKADFVIADLSTLNPNAFYELGIRHALKKNTTLLIAEKRTGFPFDLNHNVIDTYEHLGSDIGVDEAKRFKKLLRKKVDVLLKDPKTDSPVYQYLPYLEMPSFTVDEVQQIKDEIAKENTSIGDFLESAEIAKENLNYEEALHYLDKAREIYPFNDFIHQRRVLSTYKNEMPNKEAAFLKALQILKKELKLESTTDPETLGLAGAVYKRLYEHSEDEKHLELSIWSYSRGFYIMQDYYNGVNLAFLHFVKAAKASNQLQAYAHYGQALEVGKKVSALCKSLSDHPNFKERGDQVWIYQTQAEIVFSQGKLKKEEKYLKLAKKVSQGTFAMVSYTEQRAKLEKAITTFKSKYPIT